MRSPKMIGLMILGAAVLAYHPVEAQDMSGGKMASGSGGGMSMMDMMEKSKQACMMTADTLDKVMKNMADARKSGDKVQMMAAMESTENHMKTMKEHMGQCMGMMGNMMGNQDMMNNCMMNGKGTNAAKPEPRVQTDTVDHAKHHPAK